MHPEIKKFWEDAGYSISNENLESSSVITARKSDSPILETIGFGDTYKFKNKWYSEEEMLRIIRMKAFM